DDAGDENGRGFRQRRPVVAQRRFERGVGMREDTAHRTPALSPECPLQARVAEVDEQVHAPAPQTCRTLISPLSTRYSPVAPRTRKAPLRSMPTAVPARSAAAPMTRIVCP